MKLFNILICTLFLAHSVNVSGVELDSQLDLFISHDGDESVEDKVEFVNYISFSSFGDTEVLLSPVIEQNFQKKVTDTGFRIYLREGFIEGSTDYFDFKVGKQIIQLSNMDEIISTEAVTPRDFSRFIFNEPSKYFLGQDAVQIKTNSFDDTLSFIFIPKSEVHDLPNPTDYFGFRSQRLTYGLSLPELASTTLTQSWPANPELVVLDWQGSFGSGEFRVNVIHGPEFEPIANTLTEPSGLVELSFPERTRYAANLNFSIQELVVRSELIFNSDRCIQTNEGGVLSSVQSDNVLFAIGVDFYSIYDLFVSIQFLHDQISKLPDFSVRKKRENYLTFLLKRAFESIDGEASIKLSTTHENDFLMQLNFSKNISDKASFIIGLNTFDGTNDSVFGQFDSKDHLFTQLRYDF